jgi:hypothetical protein
VSSASGKVSGSTLSMPQQKGNDHTHDRGRGSYGCRTYQDSLPVLLE